MEGLAWTVGIFGSSSGFFVSFGVTTRSGSSVSVGAAFGKSLGTATAFCSTTAGDAAAPGCPGLRARRSVRHGVRSAQRRSRSPVRRVPHRRPAVSNPAPARWRRRGASPRRSRRPARSCATDRKRARGRTSGALSEPCLPPATRRRSTGTPSSATSAILAIAAEHAGAPAHPSIRHRAPRGRRAGRCGAPCPPPTWRRASVPDRRA